MLGKSQGQRSLAGCSPWGHKESATAKYVCARTHTHTHTHTPWLQFGHHTVNFSTWWGFSIYEAAHRIRRRIFCVALEKELEVPDCA